MKKEVSWNNHEITVNLGNKEDILKELNEWFKDFESELNSGEVEKVNAIYETESKSTLEDITKEKEEFKKTLAELFSDDEKIITYLDKLNIKKNGRFKKGSVSEVRDIESATSYFTDYTNAWATMRLQFKALNEDSVELQFNEKTVTY